MSTTRIIYGPRCINHVRPKLYEFFMSLKQPDGSFRVAEHMEVDIRYFGSLHDPRVLTNFFTRGIYCLLVTAALLNIITSELIEGTPTFLASCQTYEGGFSSASYPFYSVETGRVLRAPKPNLGEAHGGYTFCALASWILLQSCLDLGPSSATFVSESLSEPKVNDECPDIDLRRLTRWLVNLQGSEAELGGFKGRTNKLVDGCYSWWCGGAFAILEALRPQNLTEKNIEDTVIIDSLNAPAALGEEQHDEWVDIDESSFNRKALQEYILLASQHPAGGLRDKPPK